jgi:hypothetical protein
MFRPIDQRGTIGRGHLTDRSVARIIKGRVHQIARRRGLSEADASALAASADTAFVRDTRRLPPASTCHNIESSSTRGIGRPRWSPATSGKPTNGPEAV